MQSLVWGVYCLSRAGLRLAILLTSGVGGFVLASVATGTPLLVALVLWGIWHARRVFVRPRRGGRRLVRAQVAEPGSARREPPPAGDERNEPKPRAGGRGFGSCDASTGHAGD